MIHTTLQYQCIIIHCDMKILIIPIPTNYPTYLQPVIHKYTHFKIINKIFFKEKNFLLKCFYLLNQLRAE